MQRTPTAGILASIPLLLAGGLVKAQCTYLASTLESGVVTFTYTGGSFQSFGCAPIDPTYWLSGNGMTITATFAEAKDHPGIRVWGMNDDDAASVAVNGTSYSLNDVSASIGERVVCGDSPDPNGVTFVGGNIVGTNGANFSYQDIVLNMDGVTSITVTGITGAGWGFAGVLVDCANAVDDLTAARFRLFPNPTTGLLYLSNDLIGATEVLVTNGMGQLVLHTPVLHSWIDLSALPAGAYAVTLITGRERRTQRIIKS